MAMAMSICRTLCVLVFMGTQSFFLWEGKFFYGNAIFFIMGREVFYGNGFVGDGAEQLTPADLYERGPDLPNHHH